MISVPVQAGDTLSQIAAEHGTSLAAVEQANPNISNPNLIYAGNQVIIPSGGSFTQWAPSAQAPTANYTAHTSSTRSAAPSPGTSSGSAAGTSAGTGSASSGGLDDIPGVPSSFVSCVAFRESTNGTNAAYNGGDYGIITASGINVNGQSLGAQKQAFKQIYDTTGPSAWEADHCPGT